MKKMRTAAVLAALAGAVLCGQVASAGVSSQLLMADTLALYAADSSAIIDVSNATRLWLDIIAVPLTCAGCDSAALHASDSVNAVAATTLLSLGVQAREVLNAYAGTDTALASRGLAVDTLRWGAGWRSMVIDAAQSHTAAYADSTVIPWLPRYTGSQSATVDTVGLNYISGSNNTVNSSEIVARIRPNSSAWSSKRSVRVDFVTQAGVPFRAQFASFRWRLLSGPIGSVRLRVVLGRETW